jgi:PKD repeat protein
MNKKLLLITSGIYLLLAAIVYLLISAFKDTTIKATLYPKNIRLNELVYFNDSTSGASSIIWEFGNGDKFEKAKGTYLFKETGKYKVRLTINNKSHQTFLVDVAPPLQTLKVDSSVKILADVSGIVDQKIHFKALGKNITWCEWYFKGMGKIESRALETFYSYNKPGRYEVYLVTNLNFKKPKKHIIEIEPQYKITENIIIKPAEKPSAAGKEEKPDDFKITLQNIANGNDFNSNYNYILKKYLCGYTKTPVIVNGGKSVDFYSYCQGLQINSNITIKSATVELNSKTNCPVKIIITQ